MKLSEIFQKDVQLMDIPLPRKMGESEQVICPKCHNNLQQDHDDVWKCNKCGLSTSVSFM